jgi:glycosyltransferase involved in cell wall biosynthesis
MKIVYLAPANSIHTQRWVNALVSRGHQVTLFTQHDSSLSNIDSRVNIQTLPFCGSKGYFLNFISLRKQLQKLSPDLLNVHYASGYGFLSALVKYKPTLLSVWGSDVFDFPYESKLKGTIIRFNLRKATSLASTSHVMAKQVGCLVPDLPLATVTPFGVDCQQFQPLPDRVVNTITIGTVKTLLYKYGIDLLIKAFSYLTNDAELKSSGVASRLRLIIVGGGAQRAELEGLVKSLGIEYFVSFEGAVAHVDVPKWLNRLDIFVAASRLDSESFGVAAVEASACGIPVVVSNAGGLPEVVKDGVTGLVVPKEDAFALFEAIKKLVVDDRLREKMAGAGREHVLSNYSWEHCVDIMETVYTELLRS